MAVFLPAMAARCRPLDVALADLANRQHGVVARRQLLELGLGSSAVARRLERASLHRVHAGVYAVGHRAVSPRGLWMAAVLACGPGAVLSHRSAGAVWELQATAAAAVDVTAPGPSRRRRPGIVVHRVRTLHPDDVTRREGIPVTTVARTLLDLAALVSRRQLERAFETAERLALLDARALENACRRQPHRRGSRLVRGVLADQREPPPATRSELERDFLELCRAARLPLPSVNGVVAGFEVDALWPRQRLVVEVDSLAFHATRAAFERDRLRDSALQVAGYRVLRVTHRRLRLDPEGVAEAVGALLAPSAGPANWKRPAIVAGRFREERDVARESDDR